MIMTLEELKNIEKAAYEMLESGLHKARTQYVNDNARFKVGDYVKGITGIIKVESIKYDMYMDKICIQYCGYKYWYKDKEIVRTKQKGMSCLTDYDNNLIKLEI
jgi:hypothetical protein